MILNFIQHQTNSNNIKQNSMAQVNAYLTFNGNCEEAFNFYKSVFGGEFPYIGRFGDMPPSGDGKQVPDEDKNKIMHVSLPISQETVLMGSDTGGEWASHHVCLLYTSRCV